MIPPDLLNSTCTIQSLSTTVNLIGQVTRTFSTGTKYACRLNPLRVGGEMDAAQRRLVQKQLRVFVQDDATNTPSSRLLSKGKTYNVIQSNDYFEHHQELLVELID